MGKLNEGDSSRSPFVNEEEAIRKERGEREQDVCTERKEEKRGRAKAINHLQLQMVILIDVKAHEPFIYFLFF